MLTGTMWFDNSAGTSFGSRLEKATSFYMRRYGEAPNLCLVHPSMLNAVRGHFGRITVRAHPFVLPGHLWLGVEESPRKTRATA